MKIGLFLDVDKTLTRNFIEDEYSCALGCFDECARAEQEYKNRQISSWTALNQEIAAIFASKGFTLQRSRELFDEVALQPWTDQLLRSSGIDIYLVSTGPSYFIDTLAKRYDIRPERVLRSTYYFNRDTGLLESCAMVSDQQKATFVSKHANQYDLTIGIGDDEKSDGPFVSHCTIPLLTVEADGYIFIKDLNPAVLLIERLSRTSDATNDGIVAFDPKNLTPSQFLHLPLRTLAMFGGALAAAFGLGTQVAKLFH